MLELVNQLYATKGMVSRSGDHACLQQSKIAGDQVNGDRCVESYTVAWDDAEHWQDRRYFICPFL